MISAFGIEHVSKTYVPSLKAHKYADQLTKLQRREVGMHLKKKRAAAKTTNQPLPGIDKPQKKSQSSHFARMAQKDIRRSVRIAQGKQVSPVKQRSR